MAIIKNNVFKFNKMEKIWDIDVCTNKKQTQKKSLLLQHKSMFNKFYACKFND